MLKTEISIHFLEASFSSFPCSESVVLDESVLAAKCALAGSQSPKADKFSSVILDWDAVSTQHPFSIFLLSAGPT